AALIGAVARAQDVQQGALPRSRRPNDCQNCATRDLEVEVIQHLERLVSAAVGLRNSARDQRRSAGVNRRVHWPLPASPEAALKPALQSLPHDPAATPANSHTRPGPAP